MEPCYLFAEQLITGIFTHIFSLPGLDGVVVTEAEDMVSDGSGNVAGVVGGSTRNGRSGSLFVGRDRGSESSMVSDVVHNSFATISTMQGVGSNLDSRRSGLLAGGSSGGVLLVVSKGIASKTLANKIHSLM